MYQEYTHRRGLPVAASCRCAGCMTSTFRWWIRGRAAGAPRAAGAILASAMLTILTGCSMGSATTHSVAATSAPSSPAVSQSAAQGQEVVLRLGDQAVAATLANSAASRKLAAMLPLTLKISDAWGQAKTGRLPHPVPVGGAARTLEPTPGGIYYWPGNATLAMYYDDLGQSVPSPGLIRLGVVDTGLEQIADAGDGATVRIERVREPARDKTA